MSTEGAAVSLGATVVSLIFAALVFNQWISRRKPFQLAWSVGLALYGVAVAVAGATVDAAAFSSSIPVAGMAWPDGVRIYSPLFTIPGSVALIGIAAYSFWRSRLLFNLWIGIGAVIIAAGGSLARFGLSLALYIGEFVGIAGMFWGFLPSPDLAEA